eukprot:gene6217-12595_t
MPNNTTLLSRNWKVACFTAVLVDIVLQVFVRFVHISDKEHMCNVQSFSSWVWLCNCVETALFFSKAIGIFLNSLVRRKSLTKKGSTISAYGATFTVSIIAGSSSLLSAVWDWGGVCEDAFGVRSRASRAGEWISCVPLLLYIVISIDNKDRLFPKDIAILSSITVAMIFTFLLQFPISIEVSIVFLSLGLFFALISAILFISKESSTRNNLNDIQDEVYILLNEDNDYNGGQNLVKLRLARVLALTFPLFPIVYFLSMTKVIDHDITELLFIISNVIAKSVFASVAMDVHIEVLHHALVVQQQRADVARQTFLRYIMHEVRVPLNTISMGIDVLFGTEAISNQNINQQKVNNNINITNNQIDIRTQEQLSLLSSQSQSQTATEITSTSTSTSPELLCMMKDASLSMANTMANVTNLQSIDDGSFKLSIAPFNLIKLLKHTISSYKESIDKKWIRIDVSIKSSIPELLLGDSSRLSYVIGNILCNAIQFSEHGARIIITIICEEINDNISSNHTSNTSNPNNSNVTSSTSKFNKITKNLINTTMNTKIQNLPNENKILLKISIQDEGPGISETNQKLLFIPFVRLITGDNDGNKGSGLSLPTCHRVIQRHNGNIECHSILGHGSTFIISLVLPIFSNSTDIPSCTQLSFHTSPLEILSREENNNNNNNSNSNRNIISSANRPAEPASTYSDTDVKSCRKMLGLLLSKEGFEWEEAQNGLEAVAAIEKNIHLFQIIFMDYTMPHMNGAEATKAIRNLGYDKLIVGVTGNSLSVDIEKFIKSGVDMVFTKPFQLEELKSLTTDVRKNFKTTEKIRNRSKIRLSIYEKF